LVIRSPGLSMPRNPGVFWRSSPDTAGHMVLIIYLDADCCLARRQPIIEPLSTGAL
jgi:hypothetical protein